MFSVVIEETAQLPEVLSLYKFDRLTHLYQLIFFVQGQTTFGFQANKLLFLSIT